MTPFVLGVITGAGGVVVLILIGLLVTIPLKLHARSTWRRSYGTEDSTDRGLRCFQSSGYSCRA
ncbi:hypothetical protein K6L44_04275 [Gluconacetobacter entanii]|uniref:hypothetical protein n=1 Tax=Gluconacetobacter entanii TaxID=108528 RepID=UPI001C933461|nr:hypothetical protein [Gluconacetobacter entanii]MBY4639231.1 hypothetical protein [Gluconacetobacter entanii]MCW4580152.1 hypothetical protein [Gluconacetobacter entanii]MCW4584698.1 hypothetical protein [Gluconacetobacter entanii]MCW4588040.1 hypothetical protein [Gluconacetobacter entanii]